jgi:hypothetical protein
MKVIISLVDDDDNKLDEFVVLDLDKDEPEDWTDILHGATEEIYDMINKNV